MATVAEILETTMLYTAGGQRSVHPGNAQRATYERRAPAPGAQDRGDLSSSYRENRAIWSWDWDSHGNIAEIRNVRARVRSMGFMDMLVCERIKYLDVQVQYLRRGAEVAQSRIRA